MKRLYYIFAVFSLASCQITDDSTPSPDEAFIKYYGELTTYEANDIEVVYDPTGTIAESLMVFGTKLTQSGDADLFVLQTDLEGNLIDSISFGLSGTIDLDGDGDSDGTINRSDESAGQIHFVRDFGDGTSGFALIGTSSINASLELSGSTNVSNWQWLTFGLLNADLGVRTIGGDTLAVKFEVSENESFLNFAGNDVIQLSNGNFLLAGAKQVERPGGIEDFNYYLLSITPQAGLVFEKSEGRPGEGEDDIIKRAFEKENGNLVLIGNSQKESERGENNGLTGTNVFFLETDPNGTAINFKAHGIDDTRNPEDLTVYNETVSDVIKSSTGYSVVGTSTAGNDEYAFLMNLSNNGVFLGGNAHHFSVFNGDNNTLESVGGGITEGLDNNLILLGQYLSFNTGQFSRGSEGMFVKFGQDARPIVGAESFFGLADGNDKVVDAVTLPDGKIVAVANVDFGGGVQLISIMKLNSDGSLD